MVVGRYVHKKREKGAIRGGRSVRMTIDNEVRDLQACGVGFGEETGGEDGWKVPLR